MKQDDALHDRFGVDAHERVPFPLIADGRQSGGDLVLLDNLLQAA